MRFFPLPYVLPLAIDIAGLALALAILAALALPATLALLAALALPCRILDIPILY